MIGMFWESSVVGSENECLMKLMIKTSSNVIDPVIMDALAATMSFP